MFGYEVDFHLYKWFCLRTASPIELQAKIHFRRKNILQ